MSYFRVTSLLVAAILSEATLRCHGGPLSPIHLLSQLLIIG